MKKELYGDVNHYYLNFYHSIIGYKSKGISKLLSEYPHRMMESEFKDNKNLNILEIGVGDFEHLPFVTKNFNKYVGVDLRYPKNLLNLKGKKVEFVKSDAHSLPFENNSFDRIIATCLIVHLDNPESAIDEWMRILKPGGKLTMYIALEPSIFLQIFRKLYMSKKARKMGFEGYNLFIARDHVTYGLRIINIIKAKFSDRHNFKYRPLPFPFWFINAFCIAEIDKL
jgi:phosphatidylethanolamine/phosphatidyl-N-methylethanolamine N-methyltransferase